MPNVLSHTQVKIFSECGRKYQLKYVNRLYSKVTSGALLFGNAIDQALNNLLIEKDIDKAISIFNDAFRDVEINKESEYLPYSKKVVYAKTDFDKDLLTSEDLEKYKIYKSVAKLNPNTSIEEDQTYFNEKKRDVGHNNFSDEEKSLYAYGNWLSMVRKGHIILRSYFKKVLPEIKQVIEVQKRFDLTNTEGDSVMGFLDLIVEFHDGTRYLMDNKTSSIIYEKDSASKSQQLVLYYYAVKDEYKLDGVGFYVMYKAINKNKIKVCPVCGKNGTGQRHKTCDADIDGKRCNAGWIETINPECDIETILNKVTPNAEDLIIETFDLANDGINKKVFNPNLAACKNGGLICEYFSKCWYGKDDDLIEVKKK